MILSTSTVLTLLVLAVIHWFADFVLQTDEQATRKSSSNLWLSAHVGVYTSVMGMILIPVVAVLSAWTAIVPTPFALICFIVLNGALHWLTDWCTSRVTSQLWKAERRHDFFVMIGADQLIHLWTLGLTALWLL